MAIRVRPALRCSTRTDRWVKVATWTGIVKGRWGALFAPDTVSALAFKHADRFAGEGVEYATDEIELGVTLHAPGVFSGLFGEFFGAEFHVSPQRERGNKYQTAQTFLDQDAAIPVLYGTIS
jgi:hypothetical protein